MANWAKLQEDLVGLPVAKRAKHGIHFQKSANEFIGNFSGKPCHFQENGIWKPIDTKLLLLPDGYYGCPHSPVRVHKDGHVKVEDTDYQQYTELPSATGLVDNDCIVREFSFGKQEMRITENGYRSEITLNRIPTLQEARKLIASESGTLSKEYLKSLTTATDANGDVHTYSTLTAFRTWLAQAQFPVVIDPDFAGSTNDVWLRGSANDYATAHSTSSSYNSTHTEILVGNAKLSGSFYCDRSLLLFDTSSIGADGTVTQVNLKLRTRETNGGPTTKITKFDWSSYNPVSAANREAVFDAALSAEVDSADAVHNGTSGNLTTTWVNKTGYTYYGLINSLDIAGTEPAGRGDANIYSCNSTTESYRPVLTVTYTAGGTTGNPLMHRWRRI